MGKKTTIAAILAVVALLAGCSAKNEVTELFTPDRIYEKALVYTREDQIVRELETKAAVTATLLNEVFPDRYPDANGTYFFVGIVTDLTPEEVKKNYHILLDGRKPLSIEKVNEESALYKLMPNVNRWGKYFLVTFPPTKAKKLNLDFGIYPYGSVKLSFPRATRRR